MWRLLLATAAFLLLALSTDASRIRKDVVEIENDTIVLVDATSSLDSSTGRIQYLPASQKLQQTEPTRGIVYVLAGMDGEDCRPEQHTEDYLTSSYIRIALISSSGQCPIALQIKQAEYDGAVGAIVYNSTATRMSPISPARFRLLFRRGKRGKYYNRKGNRYRASDDLPFPVMLVDKSYGETLRIQTLSLQAESLYRRDDSRTRAIFATFYPDSDLDKLTGWEISLITLVVILALSFCASLAVHVTSSRRRAQRLLRNDHRLVEMNKHVQTLPLCALDRLVLHKVTESDVERLAKHGSPLSSLLSMDCSNAGRESLSKGSPGHALPDAAVPPKRIMASNTGGAADLFATCMSTCIVCIDEFVPGTRMRILPCGHNYHIECIDPWLTTKSSLCPLCKYDTRQVLTDLEKMQSGPRITMDDCGFDDRDGEPASFLAESLGRVWRVCRIEDVAMKIGRVGRKLQSRWLGAVGPSENRSRLQRDCTHDVMLFERAAESPLSAYMAELCDSTPAADSYRFGCNLEASMVEVKGKLPESAKNLNSLLSIPDDKGKGSNTSGENSSNRSKCKFEPNIESMETQNRRYEDSLPPCLLGEINLEH